MLLTDNSVAQTEPTLYACSNWFEQGFRGLKTVGDPWSASARPTQSRACSQDNGEPLSKPEFLVGIEVAQPHLDVAIAGEDAVWRVSYNAEGLTELCDRLAAAAPAQVVMEATGGLETEVAVALSAAGHAAVVANPRQVRDFARATG